MYTDKCTVLRFSLAGGVVSTIPCNGKRRVGAVQNIQAARESFADESLLYALKCLYLANRILLR